MATYISHSAAETETIGEEWGRNAESGLVIGLSGELGTGKTQLVKGLARGLGISERVQSPTFTLINIYTSGRLPLFHLDLYRLETVQQILGAGLEQYFEPTGVAVIEWAERWFGDLWARQPAGSRDSEGREIAVERGGKNPVRPQRSLDRRLLWVKLATLTVTERRIDYADFGA